MILKDNRAKEIAENLVYCKENSFAFSKSE